MAHNLFSKFRVLAKEAMVCGYVKNVVNSFRYFLK